MQIVVFDLETENHEYFGSKSSPANPENYIVCSGWSYVGSGEIKGVYRSGPDDQQNPVPFLDDPEVGMIVAHNAPFDVGWLISRHRESFEGFLKRGGRVYCTALAEYLISNQQDTYPALNEVAPKYGGTEKVDAVKMLWEAGNLTSQIDPALLFDEYLMGEGGDIANTVKVFEGQWEYLHEHGMTRMVLERCEGLLFISYCMANGLHVDPEIAQAQQVKLVQRIQEIKQTLQEEFIRLPETCGFKITSDFHVSALLYGGPLKYRERVPWLNEDGTPKFEMEKAYQFGESFVPLRLLENQPRTRDQLIQQYGEKYGAPVLYKSGKNKGAFKEFSVSTGEPKLKWADKVVKLQGYVQLQKYPAEFREEFKQRYTGARLLEDGTPVLSSGADALKDLAEHPSTTETAKELITLLLEIAKLQKDLGTYYLVQEFDDEGNVRKQSGMLQYLTEHNVVYHTLNATSTSTGRLSAARPNLQQVPRGDTSDVKRLFTSRYNDRDWLQWALGTGRISAGTYSRCVLMLNQGQSAGSMLEADYSALEVVTLAALSKDENLVRALLEGVDMHCLRLSKSLGEEYEDVYEKCHNKEHPEHKRYKTLRTKIKSPSFAYQYGATAQGIAYSCGLTLEEAEKFIEDEKALFPGVEAWYTGEVYPEFEATKSMHREQFDTGGWRLYYRGYYTAPDGTRYEARTYPKTVWADGVKTEVQQFKVPQMRNYPVQGISSMIVQGRSGQLLRWLLHQEFWNEVYVANTVHDSITIDLPVWRVKEVAHAMKYILEDVPDWLAELGYNIAEVQFPVEVETGADMFTKETVE